MNCFWVAKAQISL